MSTDILKILRYFPKILRKLHANNGETRVIIKKFSWNLENFAEIFERF